jgi:hypothetical protein
MGIFCVEYGLRKVETAVINIFTFLSEATVPICKKITFLAQSYLKLLLNGI